MILPPVTDQPVAKFRDNPANPRRILDVASLKPSIQKDGVLQAVGAVLQGDALTTIWGHRRLQCCRELGIATIPTRVFPGPLEKGQAERYSLFENLTKEDLKPSEVARSYMDALDSCGWTETELGRMIGKSASHISKQLPLLKLVPALVAKFDEGLIPVTSASDFAKLSEAEQLLAAESITSRVKRSEIGMLTGRKRKRGRKPTRTYRLCRGGLSLVSGSSDLKELQAELDKLRVEIAKAIDQGWDFAALVQVLRVSAQP